MCGKGYEWGKGKPEAGRYRMGPFINLRQGEDGRLLARIPFWAVFWVIMSTIWWLPKMTLGAVVLAVAIMLLLGLRLDFERDDADKPKRKLKNDDLDSEMLV
jgi:hypothetical protein